MDKRVEKTKTAITNAFYEQLRQKGSVNKLTVDGVIKQAHVSRSTFYTYYGGLHELINEIVGRFTREIRNIVANAHKNMADEPANQLYYTMYIELFTFLKEHAELTKAATQYNSDAVIDIVSDGLESMIAEYYCIKYPFVDKTSLETMAIVLTGGCVNLVRRWAKSGFEESIESMSAKLAKAVGLSSELIGTGTLMP